MKGRIGVWRAFGADARRHATWGVYQREGKSPFAAVFPF